MRRGARRVLVGLAAPLLAACISIGSGEGAGPPLQRRLVDAGTEPARRAQALVPALLIQPLPADALADTVAIAYSRRAQEFAFYQLASWTERPVRQLPRLLQQRLELRGMAGAVGLLGEPLHADWLLTLAIDTLHHDVAVPPGQARLAVTAELFDRRQPVRVARRSFVAAVPTPSADSAAAAAALSQATGRVFDELLPWLETELARAAVATGGP